MMEIMSEFDMQRKQYYNALNDIRQNGGYTFKIASGRYFLFVWDSENKKWNNEPRRFYPEMSFPVPNDSILIRIPLENATEDEIQSDTLKMFKFMASCSPPMHIVKKSPKSKFVKRQK